MTTTSGDGHLLPCNVVRDGVQITKINPNELPRTHQAYRALRYPVGTIKGTDGQAIPEGKLADPEFKDKPFRAETAYYQSKLAQVIFKYWRARKQHGSTITANCIRGSMKKNAPMLLANLLPMVNCTNLDAGHTEWA